MREVEMSKGSAISAFEVLQIVFVVLKLIGVIDWSWWFVLMPTLLPLALVVGALVFVYFVVR
jgi:hypothetical protein